jgi:hypothetical protein
LPTPRLRRQNCATAAANTKGLGANELATHTYTWLEQTDNLTSTKCADKSVQGNTLIYLPRCDTQTLCTGLRVGCCGPTAKTENGVPHTVLPACRIYAYSTQCLVYLIQKRGDAA